MCTYCYILISNSRKDWLTKGQCYTNLHANALAIILQIFNAPCREAQMTFPGQLPSRVFAVGDHVSHERRRRRRAAEAEWLTDKGQNESRVYYPSLSPP